VQPEPKTPLTCQDAIGLLADFLDQILGDRLLAELERHLAECAPCRAYLRTYRKTRDVTARAAASDMPVELRARLRDFLRDRVLRGEI
jgi:anti-sigma factor (TIGR02949 family)